MRLAGAAALAAALAAPFAITAARADEGGTWEFWGWVWAFFIGVLAFGGSLLLQTRRSPRAATAGRWVVILTLSVLGLMTLAWIVSWGMSPFTLEGLWIYPLACVPLGTVAFMLASRRRSKRAGSVWDRPPSPPS